MKCSRCEQDNPSHAKFCLECAAPFTPSRHTGAPAASYTDLERALREALDQQTATSEILEAISSSTTDPQPVFDTIVRNAARVCEAFDAVVVLADGEEFVQRAHYGPIAAVVGARYPLRGTVSG